MSGVVGKASKPQLRGLLQKQIKINIITSACISVLAATALKFGYNDNHKKVYADFYRTYDIEKEFERMRKKGLFDSC